MYRKITHTEDKYSRLTEIQRVDSIIIFDKLGIQIYIKLYEPLEAIDF